MDVRIRRALQESIYLISASKKSDADWVFEVEGSSSKTYNVCFNKIVSCNCPYNKFHHKTCKHMFFILGKITKLDLTLLSDSCRVNIFKIYPTFELLISKIIDNSTNTLTPNNSTTNSTITDDCSICFDSMSSCATTVCKCCKNNFHKSCIVKWLSNSTRTNCPLCRTTWEVNLVVDSMSKFNQL